MVYTKIITDIINKFSPITQKITYTIMGLLLITFYIIRIKKLLKEDKINTKNNKSEKLLIIYLITIILITIITLTLLLIY